MSEEEKAKLAKQIEQVEREIASTEARLGDENFVSRAPAHVVEQSRTRETELRQRLEKLRQNLSAGAA